MPRPDVDMLDEQIGRLRSGGTLTENEVKVLCDKVSTSRGVDRLVVVRVIACVRRRSMPPQAMVALL